MEKEKSKKYVYVGPIIEKLRSFSPVLATGESQAPLLSRLFSFGHQEPPALGLLREFRELRERRINALLDRIQTLLPQPQSQPKAQKAVEELSIEELRKILEEKEFGEWMKMKMREEFKRERGYYEEKRILRG